MCIIGDGDPRTCEEQNRWGNVYPRSGGLSPQLRGTDQIYSIDLEGKNYPIKIHRHQ